MKRKCSGCRALRGGECTLGFETESYHVNRFLLGFKPKEECPKPMTYADLFAAERKIVQDATKRSAD